LNHSASPKPFSRVREKSDEVKIEARINQD
jgi:hypothetical protein